MSSYAANVGNPYSQGDPHPQANYYTGHNPEGWNGQPQQQQQPAESYNHHPIPDPQAYNQHPQHLGPPQQYGKMGDNFHLGASYVPGGNDDYYMMPEVVSPTPQRVMPELENNMQEGLAHLELEARTAQGHRMSSASTVSSLQSPYLDQQFANSQARNSSYSTTPQRMSGPGGYTASYNHTNASSYQDLSREYSQQLSAGRGLDSPKFSPFPKPRNAGPNVPLSDEDKEEVLERARVLVLKSTDPEMQLAWAQDALSWVEVASQFATRQLSDGQSARSITPKIEHQLRTDAISIVSFLADQHHPKAEFMKGMWLEFGKFGHRVDKKEAFLGYRRAAEKGYARAEYRIGMQYESTNNPAKAIEHYRKGVVLRDSASNYRLGMMTLLGQHNMPQDYQRGVDLIRFAADTADENAPQGAYVYGMLLSRELPNINVPEQFLPFDLNDARLFIEKAAYLGFAKSQLKMAQAFELCQLGCEFDPALSLHYNALASRQGEAEADMAISKWFLCGYEGVFEKNEELAFTYAKRAAETKMATAEFAMGYFHEIGMYVPVDLRESEKWYNKAAEHGNKDALGRIDSIRKNNTFSKKDHEQVAISRIKSQYGSQRGGRPDRFKQKPPPMPTMAEVRVDMPDPRNSYHAPTSNVPTSRNSYTSSGGTANPRNSYPPRTSNMPDPRNSYLPPAGTQPLPLNNGPPPPRPVSTAPYPEDDVAPRFGQSHSSAPYPNQGGLRPISQMGPQADRPSSAFGIRPLTHTNSDDLGQHIKPTEPLRPATSMGNMHVAGGRGNNSGGREKLMAQGYEQQMPPNRREPIDNRAPTLPQIDMGRPANLEQASGKLQKPGPLNVNKPQPQPPHPIDPSRRSDSIPRRDPAANQFPRPERGSSTTPASNPPPQHQRPDHRTSTVQSQHSNPSRQSQRPPTTTMSSQKADIRPSSVAPSVASGTPTSTAASGPKKNGPSTFEEMGIPAGKNESDCVVM